MKQTESGDTGAQLAQTGRREFPRPETDGRNDELGFIHELRYNDAGLIPVIVQEVGSGTVLMMAWANVEAMTSTVETRRAHFFSRSRQSLWRKGETSGNELVVEEIWSDCDRDTLLFRAEPLGPTCHTGQRSCFDSPQDQVGSSLELGWLAEVVKQRAEHGSSASYTNRLLGSGLHRVAQKVGEEAVETVIAALRRDSDRVATAELPGSPDTQEQNQELVGESADLIFHLLVLLQAKGVCPSKVADELRRRHQLAGSEATGD